MASHTTSGSTASCCFSAQEYEVQKAYYNKLLHFYNASMGRREIIVTPEIEFDDLRALI